MSDKEKLKAISKRIRKAIEYGILDYIEHLQQKVEQQDKEIDRLNNIINGLEEYISHN